MKDVLVLGAGPAGIAISLLLSKLGYEVEVLDPAFFPRRKICGEFVNPQAVQWLTEQKLLRDFLELSPFPVYGMKIHDLHGKSFTGHYYPAGTARGYAIERKQFDTLLVAEARKAGVHICEGYSARKLLFNSDRVSGVEGVDSKGNHFERHARLMIGADGRNNLIGRTFGWMQGDRKLRKYAFMQYFENVQALSNFGEVHLVRDGYIGIAPLNESLANVALVIDESAYPSDASSLNSFLLNRISESPLVTRFTEAHSVSQMLTAGPLAFHMKRTSGHGTMLVGDTCGFVDPFTGEGINYAFLSASMAAPVLAEALSQNNFDDALLQQYDVSRQKVFSRKFRMARMLQKAIEWPAVSQYLIRRFADRMELGDTVVSAVGSTVPVERVWSLRFLWKLVTS